MEWKNMFDMWPKKITPEELNDELEKMPKRGQKKENIGKLEEPEGEDKKE